MRSEEIARALEGQHPTSESLNHLAFLIIHEVPTTFCRILLITSPDRLCIKAAQPLRQTQWTPLINSEYLQNPENLYWKAITERRVQVLLRDESNELTFNQFTADFGAQLNALAIFPLQGSKRVSGLLVLGEQRQTPRIPFDREALSFYEHAAREIAAELERQETKSNFSQLGYLVETILPPSSRCRNRPGFAHDQGHCGIASGENMARKRKRKRNNSLCSASFGWELNRSFSDSMK